jgi:uncharacterized protein (DUF2147 family)
MKFKCLMLLLSFSLPVAALAQSADDFLGNWTTVKGEVIARVERCSIYQSGPATAACVSVVWHENAKNPDLSATTDCFKKIGQFSKFSNSAWINGQVFDPRNNGVYSGKLTLVDGKLNLRAYLFSESLGKTEQFTRVESVPNDCDRRKNK